MDVFLIRPASPFVQMLGQVMHFQAVLSMVVYVGILVWSIHGIGLSVGVREIVLLDRICDFRDGHQFRNLHDF